MIKASDMVLLGGVPCLDFTNTKNWNDNEKPHDAFTDYASFLAWGLQLELVTPFHAEQLLHAMNAKEEALVLKHVRAVREAIYHIFHAIANGRTIPAGELNFFNQAWNKALAKLQVTMDRKGFQWKWAGMDAAPDAVLWPVLHSAAELLISDKLHRVKSCQRCGWLFLDTTKSGRRLWCDMRVCGNREKSKRHYARMQKTKTQ
jgi:predicted RNA-binding Zn ribbon-like protein